MGVLPDAPIFAALVQPPETLRSERRGWGWKSLTRHHFAHVVQCRDGALKTRTVPVQIRPWAPTACSPRQRRSAQTGKVAGASPATRTNLPESESGVCDSGQAKSWLVVRPQIRRPECQHHLGMSTGQARRASVLTSACLRVSGASPRHSATGV